MGRPKSNLVGERFGRLLAVEEAGRKNRAVLWRCKCDCGNECIIESHELKRGSTRSCGCLGRELASKRMTERLTTHGMSRQRLYKIWGDMLTRCENPNVDNYERYGGRGIEVCEEWHKFEPFMEWALTHGYRDDLSIDRIDVDGNYTPLNCKWATRVEQQNNRRDSTKLTCFGESHTIPEWERITGINRSTIRTRIRLGWPIEKVLEHGCWKGDKHNG